MKSECKNCDVLTEPAPCGAYWCRMCCEACREQNDGKCPEPQLVKKEQKHKAQESYCAVR